MALGKARFAIVDLQRVLELKPDFLAARSQIGAVYLKLGEYDKAEIEFKHVVRKLRRISAALLVNLVLYYLSCATNPKTMKPPIIFSV